jgi:ADP-ribose pyrophosphatase YjhB (NUDIX family)
MATTQATTPKQDAPGMTQSAKLIVTVSLQADHGVAYVHFDHGPDSESGWFLPNDLLHDKEGPYAAARRIAKEQTGLNVQDVQLFDVDSFTGNDDTWHIALHFRASVPDSNAAKVGTGVSRIEWRPMEALPRDEEVAHKGWYNGIAKRAHRDRLTRVQR